MSVLPVVALLVLASLPVVPSTTNAGSWAKIDKADLELSKPRVSPDADAEALLWEISVHDEGDGGFIRSSVTNYLRIKIFNDRGRDAQSKVDIPYGEGVDLEDVSARTIRPDGSTVEIKNDAIFDRAVVKGQGRKVRAKSFALPAVEPGCIVEYRWTYVAPGRLTHNLPLDLQREIPVQAIHLRFKPLIFPGHEYAMRMRSFNAEVPQAVRNPEGFLETTVTNMPAFVGEPYMPPERQTKAWVLLYYASERQPAPADFWREYGTRAYSEFALSRKVTRELKAEARAAVRNPSIPEAELGRLCEFCRARIRNISDDASGLTGAERARLPENHSPEETLERGMGSVRDINELFAVMAIALGADVRIALLADRRETLFSQSQMMAGDLTQSCVAVRGFGTWNFYDPGDPHVPCGMLPWWEQGEDALITDESNPWFERTPVSAAVESMTKRTATLRLGEDGILDGDARVEYWGHAAASMKEAYDDVSAAKREEMLRVETKERLGGADITQIALEHVEDAALPVVFSYHVRTAGLAQKTGARLLLNPAYFEYGRQEYFPTRERRYPISFAYPWRDEDSVTILLPAGLEVDAGDVPRPLESPDLARYEARLRIGAKPDRITYQRSLVLAGKDTALFPRSMYPTLKEFFDRVHEADGHIVSLREHGGGP